MARRLVSWTDIDLPQLEAGIQFLPTNFLDYIVNRRQPEKIAACQGWLYLLLCDLKSRSNYDASIADPHINL